MKYTRREPRAVVALHTTRNNTILTLSTPTGTTLYTVSAGSCGFRNATKRGPYPAQVAAERLAARALRLNWRRVDVACRGVGYARDTVIKTLTREGLRVRRLVERTGVAHNGTRPPRARRV